MKWTTLIGSGLMMAVMASQGVQAEESLMLQEQTRSLEQNQQRLEQRFQQHSAEGAGSQSRFEYQFRQRGGGNSGHGKRYEEQTQSRSSGGKGGRS